MVKMSFTSESLDDLPFGISLPIREAMRICQMNPPSAWPLAAYKLLGREDLAKMAVTEDPEPFPEKVCRPF
jgi:anaphase-promoting complex subunit 1